LLDKADVPVMPMHDLESILQDPHLVATNFFPVVEHPTEGPIRNMKVVRHLVGHPSGDDAAGATPEPARCRNLREAASRGRDCDADT